MSGERRYARCPKCGSTYIAVHETHEEHGVTDFGQHEVYDGHIVPAGDFDFSPGDSVRVEGICGDCGHEWRMRRSVA